MSKKNTSKRSKRFLGSFTLEDGRSATGELQLKGASTLLKLHSDHSLDTLTSSEKHIEGMAYTGECLTLLDCLCSKTESTYRKDAARNYHADIFPHFVAIGRTHLIANQANIQTIEFTTTDLSTIFYDFDAFGNVIDAESVIDLALKGIRTHRPVETGDMPIVSYFTGKTCIAEISTIIGKISVRHRPSYSMGGPSGVNIKNSMVISIEPENPITFNDAIIKMNDVASFLSILAGRVQGINDIQVFTTEAPEDYPQPVLIYPSLRWKCSDKNPVHKPHAGDVPLNAIFHSAEFNNVLTNWISRQSTWHIARSRSLNCLRKANKYGPDRLVAAANMFDILPDDAVPAKEELSTEVDVAKKECHRIFKNLPASIDRNSMLNALGRLGKPSLPKKVAHRVAIVYSKLGGRFQNLDEVAVVAVKCRNYFVHGSTDIEFDKIEHLLPFLTDTLEFIFSASDLIEAGWDALRWNNKPHGLGHTFARFRVEYESTSSELLRLTQKQIE
ncbi:HEPN domain-containing protein [Undibacterium sp. CY21W]|uniref:ApeA N-terminal domain 1-containing protein n=1 Tax=Undibacterium sp. CY21W TaxID=2762293 RepID=UPI00164A533E|nr:HEPN domain-containing protein [Undibacterium sp. CY21W]MBC3927314.1 hypothetical protein [Undibacterium sp. CY21W]